MSTLFDCYQSSMSEIRQVCIPVTWSKVERLRNGLYQNLPKNLEQLSRLYMFQDSRAMKSKNSASYGKLITATAVASCFGQQKK